MTSSCLSTPALTRQLLIYLSISLTMSATFSTRHVISHEAQGPHDGAFALVHCCLGAKTTTPEFPVMLVCFPTYALLPGTQLGALSS